MKSGVTETCKESRLASYALTVCSVAIVLNFIYQVVLTTFTTLTVVSDTPVFAQQTDLFLLLRHNRLVLGPQSVWVTGEDEGVTVQTGAVCVQLSARVVHGVVVIIRINDPVVIVWSDR